MVLWGNALYHDITATLNENDDKRNWELGGVTSLRQVGEDTWELSADKVVRKTPVEYLVGVASKIHGDAGLRTINAPTGEYNADAQTLVLNEADGIWVRPDHPLDWKTERAFWKQTSDIWHFPVGVTVVSDVYQFDCKKAVMKEQREIHATKGRILWWSE